MTKQIELISRTYGDAVAVEAEQIAAATGTHGPVLAFPVAKVSEVAQRVVQALAAGPMTKATLRRRVRGSQNAFVDALRETVKSGAVRRVGAGTRGSAFQYEVT